MTLVENSEGLPGAYDLVDVLLAQHARVRELIAEISDAPGEHKKRPFHELRTLLAIHEAAEEMLVHPVTQYVGDGKVADARVAEEQDAARVIARLETLDVAGPEFARVFAEFARAVSKHAEKEESEEFPALRRDAPPQDLLTLAERLMTGQENVLTHLADDAPAGAGVEAEPFSVRLERAGNAMKAA